MKKILSLFAVMTFLSVGQGAFAWTFDGLGSLNPFTNFGRGFGGNGCGCEQPRLTKCEKLHGVKIDYSGKACGYAAPVVIQEQQAPDIMPVIIEQPALRQTVPVYIEMPGYTRQIQMDPCTNCHRAF